MPITADHIIRFIERAAERVRERRDELTALDAPIGDADHGANLDRGFSAVVARLPGLYDEDAGTILDSAGKTLLATVGGAAGPLYGTAFMRAGALLRGRRALEGAELVAALEAALEGVLARGRVRPGEKTMVDAIAPGVAAMRAAYDQGADLRAAARGAVAAVEEGMRATIPMEATKGRAKFLGPRSIGHQDPGATSAYYIALAMIDVLDEVEGQLKIVQ
ncbi:MAG TPA: dihydroxyacetone kinase subunit DhaL [Roseiflexaceae bacterium]|nr:dihydroxyacetone kinase subunit DhaL [Roseiflexaceae bacterium]